MTRNKEILLVGTFFLVVIIFGAVFWRIFSGGDEEALVQIQKNAEINQAQKTATTATTTPATPAAPAAPPASNEMAMPTPTQNTDPADQSDPLSPKNDGLADPTTRKTEEDTANWKSYQAEKNIFEFKYPPDAQVTFNGDIVRVTQNGNTWKMKNYANAEKVDLQTWYNAEYSEKERTNCTLGDSTLKVASYEIKYVNSESGGLKCGKAGYFAISTDKKNVLRVELGEETVENANKILATFTFTE